MTAMFRTIQTYQYREGGKKYIGYICNKCEVRFSPDEKKKHRHSDCHKDTPIRDIKIKYCAKCGSRETKTHRCSSHLY